MSEYKQDRRPPRTMMRILNRIDVGDDEWTPTSSERHPILVLERRGYLTREKNRMEILDNGKMRRLPPRFAITPAGREYFLRQIRRWGPEI